MWKNCRASLFLKIPWDLQVLFEIFLDICPPENAVLRTFHKPALILDADSGRLREIHSQLQLYRIVSNRSNQFGKRVSLHAYGGALG